MTRRYQPARGLWIVSAVALAVRLLWLPDWARVLPPVLGPQGVAWPPAGVFDGHERGYVLAFLGQAPDPSTQAWPLLTGALELLGKVSHDVRLLVVISGLAGALAAVGVARWTARRFSPTAGLWAGLFVALLPQHAAWSTSAYNVIIPTTLLVWAAVVRRRWLAAVLVVLAVSMRGELGLLAPLVGLPGLLGPPLAAAWFWALGTPQLGDPWLALRMNLPLVAFIGPPVLLVGVLSLRDRRAWPVAGAVLGIHVLSAAFFDQGGRHELLAGMAACVLCGVAVDRAQQRLGAHLGMLSGGLLGVAILASLALATQDLAERWNRQAPLPAAELAGLGPPDPSCVEVTEEPPIAGQRLPSHVGLWTGEVTAPCVLWGQTSIHRAWTSRGLQDRALRMRTLYRLTPAAVRVTPGGPILLYRLDRRW